MKKINEKVRICYDKSNKDDGVVCLSFESLDPHLTTRHWGEYLK